MNNEKKMQAVINLTSIKRNITFKEINKIIYNISYYNLSKLIILFTYKQRSILKFFHNKNIFGVKISCVKINNYFKDVLTFFYKKKNIDSDFFFINPNYFCKINIEQFYNNFQRSKKDVGIAYYNLRNKSSKNFLINCGIFFIKKNFFHPQKKKIFKNLIFETFNSKHLFKDTYYDDYLIKCVRQNKFVFKAMFLDRDGVINEDRGWIYKPKDFKILDGVIDGIKYLNKKKFLVIIITNQSGIGRKLYSVKQFQKLQKYFSKKLEANNCNYDDLFFCPHHPQHGKGKFKIKCKCRKPGSKMLEDAVKKWSINKKLSMMIGDKETDELAAQKAKINFFYKKDIKFTKQIKQILNKQN